MAAYKKDQLPILGVASPERRTAQREALGDWRAPTEDELSDFARACWAKDEREFQYAACDTLLRHVKRIGPDALDLCEDLIPDKPWWDTTDALASRVVAFHARRPVIERWLTSGNLWLERTAIIHQLGDKQATDEAFLFHACLTHAASTDFFHRKAIGWALRQYAKVSPDTVRIFVADHADELSGLSKREALKHL